MHFTLWPSLTNTNGGHTEIDWGIFLSFLASPVVAANKNALEGWSPARFQGNRRARANAELVSAIALDDDATGLTLEQLRAAWQGFAGAVHSTHSHTAAAPKWRIVLRVTRDMTPDEHARVWRFARDAAIAAGQKLDESTKDPSRFWFIPAHAPGATYEWGELVGVPLDVDAILTTYSATDLPERAKEHHGPDQPGTLSRGGESNGQLFRRKALALALGAAWPPDGQRRDAHLALAGALRGEGFSREEALEFLRGVYAAAGGSNEEGHESVLRSTYSRAADAPTTGWTRLKSHVDGVLVDAARAALGKDADFTERTQRRLVELGAARSSEPAPADVPPKVAAGPIVFETGGYDADLPPIDYQIDGLIARGDVVMFVAHGNSLKTWIAYSIAASIATGRPWLGRFATQRGRAGILDFESGKYEVLRRLKLLGVREAEVGDRLLRCSYPAVSMTDPETWISLAEQRLDSLAIDSYNAAAPELDENDARAALMLQHAGRVAEAVNMTTVFIHHARKGTGGDDRESVRGSTALYAACDRVFKFTDLEKQDGGIVMATMHSVKDGAGRTPLDVRVELSDRGLRFLELEKPESDEKKPASADKNRALVLDILRGNSAGVPKEHLVNIMTGKREKKFELLSQLVLGQVVVEFKSAGVLHVMLKP